MSDFEILKKHGELGTFIIKVQQRKNSTWQGHITWVEEKKTVHFRSVLELLRLLDGVIAPKKEVSC